MTRLSEGLFYFFWWSSNDSPAFVPENPVWKEEFRVQVCNLKKQMANGGVG